jgi:hypothetical protein
LSGLRLDRFDVGSRKQGTYILQHNLWDKLMKKKWNLLNIYGPPQDEHKDEFLAELATFCSRNKEPYLAVGDFNILRFFSDRNKNFHPNRFSDTFNAIIHVNELRDQNVWRCLHLVK